MPERRAPSPHPAAVASGRDSRESTINIGTPPDQLPKIIDAASDWKRLTNEQRKLITDLEGKLGVSAGALRAFFRTLGATADVPPERQEGKLVEIAERYKQLVAQVAAVPGDDPEVAELKGEAQAALNAGELERADNLLARVQAAQDAALERQLEAAATAAQRGEIARTRLRYRDAAQHFAAAGAEGSTGTRGAILGLPRPGGRRSLSSGR